MPCRSRSFSRHARRRARARSAWIVTPIAGLFALAFVFASLPWPSVHATGTRTAVELRMLDYAGGNASPRPSAAQRLSWEVRQRTSVDMQLEPGRVKLTDPTLFDEPLLWWAGDRTFPLLSQPEVQALRRFVDFGGTVLIDDESSSDPGFDLAIRRELSRAFGVNALVRLPGSHVVFRSFYLVGKPVGRIDLHDGVEAIERSGRAAVIYTQNDLGGAYERDNLGNYAHSVMPGGSEQRELAFRFGVNLVLYALCLDYKDDQVHAPFIMRRWTARP
jgi:Domain of unknown function (DUF4159)